MLNQINQEALLKLINKYIISKRHKAEEILLIISLMLIAGMFFTMLIIFDIDKSWSDFFSTLFLVLLFSILAGMPFTALIYFIVFIVLFPENESGATVEEINKIFKN